MKPENERFCLTLMIIAGAMIMGCALFLAMTMFFVFSGQKPMNWELTEPLTLVALAVLVPGIVMSFIVPQLVYRGVLQNAKYSETDSIEETRQHSFQAIQTTTILKFAIIEGAVLLCLVAFLVTASWIPLVLAGLGIAILIARFPWPRNVQTEIEQFMEDAKRA